ncbi:class I SAM-dependent methyltransferase [Algicella marina]|nr:methyltransferase domain-containing protein [Algicella marina]
MERTEDRVVAHYGVDGLMERIEAALVEAGADLAALMPADLKPVDEFHTGGLQATEDLLSQLEISPEMAVLDIGSGLGGTARFLTQRFGVRVTGVDLTPEFVDVATRLSAAVGLQEAVRFETGSALDLPAASGSIDLETMLHVGMNIEDKAALMAEVARVLAPGGRFAVFDVMRTGEGALEFPYPWAEEAGFSFVAPPEDYLAGAEAAGLLPVAQRDRSEFALSFYRNVFAKTKEMGGPPPVGLHLLMRGTAGPKLQNYMRSVEAGLIAPCEMIFAKPG